MSFPRLVLDGVVGDFTITKIELAYDNPTGAQVPYSMTRAKYDVQRQTRNSAVASGTKLRYPDVVYDQFRLVHRWIGYVDVVTQSVAYSDYSSDEAEKTVALLKTAAFLRMTRGPEYTIREFTGGELGMAKPTNGVGIGWYVDAFEQGQSWIYAEDSEGQYSSIYWFIRGTSIVDNGNNTSRVTFDLECVEPWQNIKTIIDAWS